MDTSRLATTTRASNTELNYRRTRGVEVLGSDLAIEREREERKKKKNASQLLINTKASNDEIHQGIITRQT